MYQKARVAADYPGLTFHEYLKHLIAQDIQNLNIPSYKLDDETARDILRSYREYREGEFKTIDPSNEKQINEIFRKQINIGNKETYRLIEDVEKSIRRVFKKKLKKIIIFGSYARSDYDDKSDIDFRVLVKSRNLKKFEDMILDIEVDISIKYGKLPSILIYNIDGYYRDIDVIDLLKNIESEGIEFYAA